MHRGAPDAKGHTEAPAELGTTKQCMTQMRVCPPSPCHSHLAILPVTCTALSGSLPPLLKSRLQGSSEVLGTAPTQLWVQRLRHPDADAPGSGLSPSSPLHPDGMQQAREVKGDPGACCNHGGEIQSGEGTGWSWLLARPLQKSCRCSGACGRPRPEPRRFHWFAALGHVPRTAPGTALRPQPPPRA